MKKDINQEMEDELRPEYDLAQLQGGVKGKYTERYRQGTNLVLLEPDVAQARRQAGRTWLLVLVSIPSDCPCS